MRAYEVFQVGKLKYRVIECIDSAFVLVKINYQRVRKGRKQGTQQDDAPIISVTISRDVYRVLDEDGNSYFIHLYYSNPSDRFAMGRYQQQLDKILKDEREGAEIRLLEKVGKIRGRKDEHICYIWRIEHVLDKRDRWAPKERAIVNFILNKIPEGALLILENGNTYLVEKYLSAFGAFSTVFRGSSDSDDVVAIKIQRSDTASYEANILRNLNGHKNIVTFIDLSEIAECQRSVNDILHKPFSVQSLGQNQNLSIQTSMHCLITEYVKGKNLDKHRSAIRKKVDYLSLVRELIQQICDTVDYIHDSGYLHLDIKPENIMVDEIGVVKFVDMGSIIKKGDAFMCLGTGPHSAPEIREYIYNSPNGWLAVPKLYKPSEFIKLVKSRITQSQEAQERISGSADIFSVGAILYHFLTGHPPQHVVNIKASSITIKDVLVLKKDLPNNATRYFPILQKALALKPNQRYQNCNQMKQAIMEL